MYYSLICKYVFYDLDPDQGVNESRKYKHYTGDISGLIKEIKERPLDEMEINLLNPLDETEELIQLAQVLHDCFLLGVPYRNNMY